MENVNFKLRLKGITQKSCRGWCVYGSPSTYLREPVGVCVSLSLEILEY